MAGFDRRPRAPQRLHSRTSHLNTRLIRARGRAQQVAAQVLELLAGARGQGDVGVEREPRQAGAPELDPVPHRGGGAQPAHRMARAGAAGDQLLDRSGGVAGPAAASARPPDRWGWGPRRGARPDAAGASRARGSAPGSGRSPRRWGPARGGRRGPLPSGPAEDAIKDERVEMNIGVQGRTRSAGTAAASTAIPGSRTHRRRHPQRPSAHSRTRRAAGGGTPWG